MLSMKNKECQMEMSYGNGNAFALDYPWSVPRPVTCSWKGGQKTDAGCPLNPYVLLLL